MQRPELVRREPPLLERALGAQVQLGFRLERRDADEVQPRDPRSEARLLDSPMPPLGEQRAGREPAQTALLAELASKRLGVVLSLLPTAARRNPPRAVGVPVPEQEDAAVVVESSARIAVRSGSPLSRPASSRNQRRRSSQGTAAFAGEVEGRTKSFVSPSCSGCNPSSGRRPKAPRYASLPTKASQPRPQLARDVLEPVGGAGEVAAPQVARAGCRAVGGIRDADSLLEQGELLGRLVQAGGQTRGVQQAPEVVARVREVRARGGGHAARVDADEDDAEIRSEHIGHVTRVASGPAMSFA